MLSDKTLAVLTGGTQGVWRQGKTLLTAQTRRWSPERMAANEAVERLKVFANFTPEDEGRSRDLIADCRSFDDARKIALVNPMARVCEAAAELRMLKDTSRSSLDAMALLDRKLDALDAALANLEAEARKHG